MMNSVNDKINEALVDQSDEGLIIGVVTDNDDPLGINRVKVSIPNLFVEGQESPWIGRHPQSPFGCGPDYGTYGSPKIGSEVRILFQDGNIHYGLQVADNQGIKTANPKFKDPQTWGFKDPSGNELWVHLESKKWEFTAAAGVQLKYDGLGNVTFTVPKDRTETIGQDSTTNVNGSLNFTVQGDIAIITDNDCNITASGNVTISGSQVNIN